MAGKKKSKKASSNPARGFATTSSASKSKSESKEEQTTDVADVPSPPSPKVDQSTNDPAGESSTATALTELSPDQLEAQLEEAELQSLLENHREKVHKIALRHISRLKTERRLWRQSAEPLRLTSWLSEDAFDSAFNHVKSGSDLLFKSRTSPKALNSPLSEEDLCIRLWALKIYLTGLDFVHDKIEEALIYILRQENILQNARGAVAKERLWGADECLEYLALSCDSEELPGYENHQTERLRKDAQELKMGETHVGSGRGNPLSFTDSGASTPASASGAHQSRSRKVAYASSSDGSGTHDSDSDIDPKDQLEKYIQFKTRLYRRRPSLTRTEPQKGKKQRDRQSPSFERPNRSVSKLQQRIRKLERDLLFDKEEADEAWSRLRIRLEVEAAERRKAERDHSRESFESNKTPKSVPTTPETAGEDLADGFGEFFLSLPDEGSVQGSKTSNLSIQDNDNTIIVRDFGKWTGLHPRRVLEETCRARDPKVRLNLSLVSTTSFSNRHKVSIRWSRPQEVPPKVQLPGLEFQGRSLEVSTEMVSISCPEKPQSEAYICTAALFLIFSSSAKEEKVYLRLPSVWRGLWGEFNEAKRQQDDATEREELRKVRDLIRNHRTEREVFDLKQGDRKTNNSASDRRCPSDTVDPNAVSRDHIDLAQLWQEKISNPFYQRMLPNRKSLPIWGFKDQLLAEVSGHQALIICGETGCGKSTQVPAYILENELSRGKRCKIYCTQPRRISAISLARRVSEELGEKRNDLGTSRSLVGYAIRLESQITAQTRLIYATTGIVMRMLENEHGLDEVTHLILDEVHERTIESDFLLIVLRKLMSRRPELKVILMSATVDAEHFSKYFGGAPVFNVPGRTFPVETLYLEDAIEVTNYGSGSDATVHPKELEIDEDSVEDEFRQQTPKSELAQYSLRTREVLVEFDEYRINFELIVRLLETIATRQSFVQYSKAILVFLPGIGEIRRLNDILSANEVFGHGWMIYSLHSSISTEEQERAFLLPQDGFRKVVLATNIAETGITIPDITCVVDSGKHREIRFDERRQLSRLLEVFISQANAKQRRGRAGRVQNGLCFHLFTRMRLDRIMPVAQTPEMLRLSLQDLALRVKICKLGEIEEVLAESLDPPLAKNVRRAVDSLIEVKALTVSEDLTPLGRQLAKLPLDVYLGKLLLFSSIFKCIDAGLSVAAILSSKSPFVTPMNSQSQARLARLAFKKGNSDVLTVYNAYCSWRRTCQSNPSSEFQYCRKNYLSPQTLSSIEDLKNQLATVLVDAGFMPLNSTELALLNRARFSARRRQFMVFPSTMDENSENDTIVTSVIAWSFYPKLLIRDGKGYRSLANNQSVSLHPSSVNKGTNEPAKFLSFYHIMQSSSRFYNAHESSAVEDLAVALLCGDGESRLYSGTLSIDGNRLRFSAPDWKSIAVLKMWRTQFGRIVAQGIERPGMALDDEQRFWFELWQHICSKDRLKK